MGRCFQRLGSSMFIFIYIKGLENENRKLGLLIKEKRRVALVNLLINMTYVAALESHDSSCKFIYQ